MKNLLKYLFVFLLSLNLIEAQNKIEKVSLTYGEELPDDNQKIVKIALSSRFVKICDIHFQ